MGRAAQEAGSTRLTNYLGLIERALDAVGPTELWARFPRLHDLHDRLALPFSHASLGGPLPHAVASDLFAAIRTDCPGWPDFIGSALLRAARLDLQDCVTPPEYQYRMDDSESDRALLASIGEAMGLPGDTANYLCHVSNRHRYLYVATPKVACTTLKHCLQQFEMDGRLAFRHYGEEHFPSLSPLLSALDNPKAFFDALQGDDWFRFTFVRDPFSRVLSCYLDKIVRSQPERTRMLPLLGLDPAAGTPSFAAFLQAIRRTPVQDHDLHWAPQHWLTQPEKMRYHFIGRLERFDEDFGYLRARLGLPGLEGQVRHSTGADEKLALHYGAEEIALVQSIYADDFTAFGYDSGRLTPR